MWSLWFPHDGDFAPEEFVELDADFFGVGGLDDGGIGFVEEFAFEVRFHFADEFVQHIPNGFGRSAIQANCVFDDEVGVVQIGFGHADS